MILSDMGYSYASVYDEVHYEAQGLRLRQINTSMKFGGRRVIERISSLYLANRVRAPLSNRRNGKARMNRAVCERELASAGQSFINDP
jgi:hypothetical protein